MPAREPASTAWRTSKAPVWIGADVEIAPDVRLQGPLVIGDGSRIGAGAALKDSIVSRAPRSLRARS